MKPNFETMTRHELKSYVLRHRDNREAFDLLMSRHSPIRKQFGMKLLLL